MTRKLAVNCFLPAASIFHLKSYFVSIISLFSKLGIASHWLDIASHRLGIASHWLGIASHWLGIPTVFSLLGLYTTTMNSSEWQVLRSYIQYIHICIYFCSFFCNALWGWLNACISVRRLQEPDVIYQCSTHNNHIEIWLAIARDGNKIKSLQL